MEINKFQEKKIKSLISLSTKFNFFIRLNNYIDARYGANYSVHLT